MIIRDHQWARHICVCSSTLILVPQEGQHPSAQREPHCIRVNDAVPLKKGLRDNPRLVCLFVCREEMRVCMQAIFVHEFGSKEFACVCVCERESVVCDFVCSTFEKWEPVDVVMFCQ